MSRYRGPRLKKIRRLGALPGLTRKTPKSGSNLKKKFNSGKKEQYRIRLQEKQKLRFHYGLTERQLLRYVHIAGKAKRSTGQVLLQLLEMRLAISSTSNLYIRIADRGIIKGVRSTYFMLLSNFMVDLIRTLFAFLINNRQKKRFFYITCLFYYNYNKSYMEMPAKEKIYLIVSRPISIFRKKKQEFSSFFINIKKKEYN